ncbi:hypothetical protein RCL_jg16105.t1 [Rhizophagus clarus]|uniref:Uncharacterized protein n=1 Tax=Rhizophagus clarus TaxID=94130 RepID=A0A8H3QLD9_9GLOM|nr:hypothetical protein RCL_jg16105.t1 [Rhizophagus clarus]
MAYVPPTEPTGPSPAYLIAMDINQLLDTLRTNADTLLVNSQITVGPNLININNDIKHIIRMIITPYYSEQNTATGREIHGIRQRLVVCQNERNGLLNERNGLLNERNRLLNERNNLVNANRGQAYQLQEQQVRHRRIMDNLQQRNNGLTHELAIE